MANNSINRKILAVLESLNDFLSEESKDNLRILAKLPRADCYKYINCIKDIMDEQLREAVILTLQEHEDKINALCNDLDHGREFNLALDLVAGRPIIPLDEEIEEYGTNYNLHLALQFHLFCAIENIINKTNEKYDFIKLTPDMIFVIDTVLNQSTTRIKNIKL